MKKLFLTTTVSTGSLLTKEYYKNNVDNLDGLKPFLKGATEWLDKGNIEYENLVDKN